MLIPWKESYDQPREHIKKQRHYFAKKVHLVKAMVFPVVMYGCDSAQLPTIFPSWQPPIQSLYL